MTREERDELVSALRDAIEHADKGWSYAADYFVQKWGAREEAERLRAILKRHEDEGVNGLRGDQGVDG